ncbi:TRAFAC clade GTPase domain-containing protein [Burkholderia gladioli]|uniref:TRAFAC clade GTPase domain-containing protein n=1 Tax=Burkholderia gladioli TaxID=28095 RepID=UPI001ABA471D|nr:hypothetical protein [Burkholderia gladioli]
MTNEDDEIDVDVFDETSEREAPEADSDWVALPTADLLSVEGADELLRWRPANLVAIVGERNSGKTTLISEIYERYLRGPFADQDFCQSRTLIGFEQKTYQSRAETNASQPDTPRTSGNDGLRFFHLGLRSRDTGARRDILISERAGEKYRDARDQPTLALAFEEIRKARIAVFILDGQRVADDLQREEAFASVRGIARSFFDVGAMPPICEAQLVTTKFDLLSGESQADARGTLDEFQKRFINTFEQKFVKVTTWQTAARDPKGTIEAAWGVAPLLLSWLDPLVQMKSTQPSLPVLTDEFDRLLLRRERAA